MRTGMIGSSAHAGAIGTLPQLQRHSSQGPCFCGRPHSQSKLGAPQFGSQAPAPQDKASQQGNVTQPQDPLAAQQDTVRFLAQQDIIRYLGELNKAFANSVAGRFFVNLGSNLEAGQSLPEALEGAVKSYAELRQTQQLGEQNEQVAQQSVEAVQKAVNEEPNKP